MSQPHKPSIDRSDIDLASATVLAAATRIAQELHSGRERVSQARLDSSIANELALDSLARLELGARLERAFDITLNETAVFEAETPRDLLRLIVKARAGAPLTIRTPAGTASDAPSTGTPSSAETLGEMLTWHVQRHPERAHIQIYDDYSDGEILTYADLHAGSLAVAGGLQAQGLLPGERVAVMLPTGRAYFFVFYGIVLAGGVPVPIYPPVRRQQLEDHLRRQSRILKSCRASMLVTSAEALGVARLLTASVDSLRHVLAADRLAESGAAFDAVQRSAEDLAFVQYTSGSTGDPKGVMLTHTNVLANVRADGHAMAATSSDVFVSWLPLYHDMGLIGAWLGSLYHGVRLVVMPPLTFLARPERWLWAIDRYGGTLSAAPNFAFELCVKRISDDAIAGLDLSRWRIAANGAEAISARTLNAFCARFAPYGFAREAMFPVYGLAECTVGLAFPPPGRGPLIDVVDRDALARSHVANVAPDRHHDTHTLSVVACGQPLPGHEIRIVDEADRELPDRHEGRLQFRGPSATSGYFDRPRESAALIRDGWLESGDLAYIAAGDLYVTGRSKDIIIRAGRNIYPAELEDAIGDLDGVRKGHVAVFASPDPHTASERVVVLAESRKRSESSRAALRLAINELATDLITAPADEVVIAPPNTVLRTSSGKIRRSACRALYEQDRIGHGEQAVWLQLLRLALSGVVPQTRRAVRRLNNWLFAIWAWSSFVGIGVVAWLTAWLPLPRRALWRIERTLARASGWLTATPITVSGAEHLPPEGQACVVVTNHQSYLDGIVVFALLPRPPRLLIKGELKRSRWLARPLASIGGLFVERFDAVKSMDDMHDAAQVLDEGGVLAVFPEGTFKRMPGLLPFHMGAFAAAAAANVPVVPIAIRGTRSILRPDSWFPRRGGIDITFGAPIWPTTADRRWTSALLLRDTARAHLLKYSNEPDLAHESNIVEAET